MTTAAIALCVSYVAAGAVCLGLLVRLFVALLQPEASS
jgi:K+-transporting ATPase KdpF subunit